MCRANKGLEIRSQIRTVFVTVLACSISGTLTIPSLVAQAQADFASDSLTLCVLDSAAAVGMRAIQVKTPEDSLATSGERTYLPPSKLHPRGIGYPTGPSGFDEEWVRILGAKYGTGGGPRPISVELLMRIGEIQGVSVFIERGIDISNDPEMVYVLTPACDFFPYARLMLDGPEILD